MAGMTPSSSVQSSNVAHVKRSVFPAGARITTQNPVMIFTMNIVRSYSRVLTKKIPAKSLLKPSRSIMKATSELIQRSSKTSTSTKIVFWMI